MALGAAIQAAVLTGETKDIVLLDVTPLTLGIETLGGIATKLIERNTTIPTRKSRRYSRPRPTARPVSRSTSSRASVHWRRTTSRSANSSSPGIPPAPRGIPQIEVTFDIDSNGIIHVSAKDLGTGNQQAITIKGSKRLNENEIKKMVEDSKSLRGRGQKKKEEIEIRNQADTAIFSAEQMLKENGDKIEAEDRVKVEEAVAAVRKALGDDDLEGMKREMESLSEALYAATTKLYQKVQAEAAASQAAGSRPAPGRRTIPSSTRTTT